MTKRARLRATEREVRVVFEPSRTAAKCVILAYARVVPLRRRELRSCSAPVTAGEDTRRIVEERRG
jgi:hypothetical protein